MSLQEYPDTPPSPINHDIERHPLLRDGLHGTISKILSCLDANPGVSMSIADLSAITGTAPELVFKATKQLELFLNKHPELVSFEIDFTCEESHTCKLSTNKNAKNDLEDIIDAVSTSTQLERKLLCLLYLLLMRHAGESVTNSQLCAELAAYGVKISARVVSRSMGRLIDLMKRRSAYFPIYVRTEKNDNKYQYSVRSISAATTCKIANLHLPFIVARSEVYLKIYNFLLEHLNAEVELSEIMREIGETDKSNMIKIMNHFCRFIREHDIFQLDATKEYCNYNTLTLRHKEKEAVVGRSISIIRNSPDIIPVDEQIKRRAAFNTKLDTELGSLDVAVAALRERVRLDAQKQLILNASWGIHAETPQPIVLNALFKRLRKGICAAVPVIAEEIALETGMERDDVLQTIHILDRKCSKRAAEFGFAVVVIGDYVSLLCIDDIARRTIVHKKYAVGARDLASVVPFFDATARFKKATARRAVNELDQDGVDPNHVSLLRYVVKQQSRGIYPTIKAAAQACQFGSTWGVSRLKQCSFADRFENRIYVRSRTKSGLEAVLLKVPHQISV